MNMRIPDYIKRSWERKEDGKPKVKPDSLPMDPALKETPKAAEPTEEPATAVVTPEKVAAQFYVQSKDDPKTN